ncbi:MAG: putative manganese transporter [Bacilli bacterium]|nr:putative manganese transporter [Bacillales bacterium]MDY2575432.1 putative manganese transporter [Bacilli bacterium]
MTFQDVLDILVDSLLESLIVLAFVFAIYVLLSFVEVKIAKKISKENKLSPLFGSLFGLVPQCGVSVVASDLYLKEHITMGTLVAIFLSCNDEAIPLLIASHNEKALSVIPLVILKFVIGFIVGFVLDWIIRDRKHVEDHLDHCHHEEEVHVGCCHHHIDDEKENKIKKYLVHPLIHSLKIFAYVFAITFAFSLIIALVGEDNIKGFLQSNKYLSPLFSVIIGLIPNCASSVLISELYVMNGLSFGSLLGGLLMNSGLGLVYLLKSKKNIKNTLLIVGVCFLVSIICSYLVCLIIGF